MYMQGKCLKPKYWKMFNLETPISLKRKNLWSLFRHGVTCFREFHLGTNDGDVAEPACLKSLPSVVTPEQNTELLKAFTPDELEEAVKQLPTRKVAGLDGIPTEALKLLLPDIGPLIHGQFDEALLNRKLHPFLNRGLQSLIPEGGSICCPCPSATGQVCTFSSFLGFWVLGFRVPKFSSILGLQNVGRWNSFTKLECLLFLSPFWHLLLLPICNKAGLYVFFFSYA